jgi:hypothetical protein
MTNIIEKDKNHGYDFLILPAIKNGKKYSQ